MLIHEAHIMWCLFVLFRYYLNRSIWKHNLAHLKYKNICKGVEHVCKAYKLTILKEIAKPITPLIEVNS